VLDVIHRILVLNDQILMLRMRLIENISRLHHILLKYASADIIVRELLGLNYRLLLILHNRHRDVYLLIFWCAYPEVVQIYSSDCAEWYAYLLHLGLCRCYMMNILTQKALIAWVYSSLISLWLRCSLLQNFIILLREGLRRLDWRFLWKE